MGQIFTSNGTFTVPSGVTEIDFVLIAGGGGAGSGRAASSGYGGAGGAGLVSIWSFVNG